LAACDAEQLPQPPPPPTEDPLLVRYRQRRDSFSEPTGSPHGRALVAAAGVLAVVALAGAAEFSPVLLILLVLSAVLVLAARIARPSHDGSLAQFGGRTRA